MKKAIVVMCALSCLYPFTATASPTNQQLQERDKYEKILRAEVLRAGSNMSKEQADMFSNQIISAVQTINTNQFGGWNGLQGYS